MFGFYVGDCKEGHGRGFLPLMARGHRKLPDLLRIC